MRATCMPLPPTGSRSPLMSMIGVSVRIRLTVSERLSSPSPNIMSRKRLLVGMNVHSGSAAYLSTTASSRVSQS